MRSIYCILLLIVFAGSPAMAQLGYGPELGIGMSNMLFKPDNVFTSSSTSSIFSGRVGAMMDVGFTQHVYFQSGLFLSRKGQKRSYSFYYNDSVHDAEQQTLYLHYLDLPLNIVFKSGAQGKKRLCLGVGATVSYLAWGKNIQQATGSAAGEPYDVHTNEVFKEGTVIRSFDIGVSVFAAFEMPTGLFLKAYFNSGVKDLGFHSEIDKNRMWGIGVGYIMGKGRNINKDTEGLIDKSDN